MPIFLDTAGTALVNSPHFGIVPRVSFSVAGEGLDLSPKIHSFSIDYSIDNVAGQATISFARGLGVESLAPLVAASQYAFSAGRPALDLAVRVTLYTDLTDPLTGTVVREVKPFSGWVDTVRTVAGEGLVAVECRDEAAPYLDYQLDTTRTYGAVGGQSALYVLLKMLDDNGFPTSDLCLDTYDGDGVGLGPATPPTFMVLPYPMGQTTLLDQMRRLAQQFGWDIRSFPPDTSYLRLYDPERTNLIAPRVIFSTRYETITELDESLADVRNVVQVEYQDPADNNRPKLRTYADTESIARYRRRFTRVTLDRTTNIDTVGESDTYGFSALRALKDPLATHSIRAPYLPAVLLNDRHTYKANGDEYDQDLTLVVSSYQHEYADGHATTTVGARQTPLGAHREYRQSRHPRLIVATVAPTAEDLAPEGTRWVNKRQSPAEDPNEPVTVDPGGDGVP